MIGLQRLNLAPRRLGRFHGGLTIPAVGALDKQGNPVPEVKHSAATLASSTSASTEPWNGKTITARFGGAEKCCAPETYAHPTTTVFWSDWFPTLPAGEPVVVPCGHKVIFAGSSASLRGLRIEGTLEVADDGADHALETGYVFNCGTLRADLQSARGTTFTVELSGHEKIPGHASFSTKAFATKGGDLDLRGSACNATTWTTLAATADAGARVLRLAEPVDATAWRPGAEVMVASTDVQGTQTEVATIEDVRDGGRTLALAHGLVYPHAGVAPITAEVALLTRNIKITSEARCKLVGTDGDGKPLNGEAANKPMCGHFVVDHTPRGVVCGVELTNLGKHTTTGKYPLHIHMAGDAPAIQIRSNAVHSNHHRALVLHGVSNSTWADNVVFRSVGHLLLTEDGGEEGNRILRNVLALPQRPVPGWPSQCAGIEVNSAFGGCELHRCSHGTGIYEAVCGNRHDGETAAMWISNPNNVFEDNRIIAGQAVGMRFETRGTTGRVALLPKERLNELFAAGRNRKELGSFARNVIHSSKHGIFNYPSWNPGTASSSRTTSP